MGGADTLKTEGLVLQGMHVSHVRAGCEAELPTVSIRPVWTEAGKTVTIIRPGSHKAL
jgi:hypothetical protein